MIKRIFLFVLTNLAIIIVLSIILSIFNVQPYLTKYGLDYTSLLIFAAIVGFTGAFISLFISKWMAIHAFGVQIIKTPETQEEQWIISTIRQLSEKVGIGMPDVGIYQSPEPNAFATGWNRNKALVAISSGLLQTMDRNEVEGVLGHEISHVANGDMVTLTLIQGVLNTFVIFFARIAAFFVTQLIRRDSNSQGGFIYYGVALIFEIIFGILATIIVMWFARRREFRADKGSAMLYGKDKMIDSLKALQRTINRAPEDNRAPAFNAFKISEKSAWFALFSSHPPLEKRIEALNQMKN